MTASVGRKADGTPDFDPYIFRRQLSELWQTDPNDIILNISVTVRVRSTRALQEIQTSASDIFNITVMSVNPMVQSCDVVTPNDTTISTFSNYSMAPVALEPTVIVVENYTMTFAAQLTNTH